MKTIDLLLINPPFHKRNGSGKIFPLGLGYIISAVCKDGFTSDVIDCSNIISTYKQNDLSKLQEYLQIILKNYNPSIVGIGPCVTPQVKSLKIIADCCKKIYGKKRIFAGGPLASIKGQKWFFFDFLEIEYIIKGDGEKAIVEMLKCIKRGEDISKCKYVTSQNYSFLMNLKILTILLFLHGRLSKTILFRIGEEMKKIKRFP